MSLIKKYSPAVLLQKGKFLLCVNKTYFTTTWPPSRDSDSPCSTAIPLFQLDVIVPVPSVRHGETISSRTNHFSSLDIKSRPSVPRTSEAKILSNNCKDQEHYAQALQAVTACVRVGTTVGVYRIVTEEGTILISPVSLQVDFITTSTFAPSLFRLDILVPIPH